MFVKHVCPLSLNVTVTLTFDLETPNSIGNRGHLLIMPNHDTKLEDPRPMCSQVIDLTRFVYQPTDRHVQSNLYPFEGGHNKTPNIIVLFLKKKSQFNMTPNIFSQLDHT